MIPQAVEVNFDGLVGPTHSYAGLSYGNLASQSHRHLTSRPRDAALQGLAKMKLLADLGVRQAVLPPHERPDISALRRLGFTGPDAQVLDQARRQAPTLLAACGSASAMWAANAATVSPSADTADGRVHFTPANLIAQFHRSLESPTTDAILRALFRDESAFAHHSPLPAAAAFGDEGAANHIRLAPAFGAPGIEIFIYGKAAGLSPLPAETQNAECRIQNGIDSAFCVLPSAFSLPPRFPARQTLEASAAIARLHQLDPSRSLFIQQNPHAINAGAFHNDVVAVGHLNVLLYHAAAFVDSPSAIASIQSAYAQVSSQPLHLIEVSEAEVPLADAVQSYLFNSQIVSLPDGTMALIAPAECRENPASESFLRKLLTAGSPIASVHFVELRQSMHNGGGPACLRLRIVLTDAQLSHMNPHVCLTDALHRELTTWIHQHYREELHPDDLADPRLLDESRAALDVLTQILHLGS